MKRRKRKTQKPLGNHVVGYCRPPVGNRFQPGVSGNPKGRPKDSSNVDDIVERILMRKVKVRDADGERRVAYIEALLLRAADSAGKGNLPALKFLTDFWARRRAQVAETAAHDAPVGPVDEEDLALVADYLARQKNTNREAD